MPISEITVAKLVTIIACASRPKASTGSIRASTTETAVCSPNLVYTEAKRQLSALVVRSREYVTAARALGTSAFSSTSS